MLMIAGVLDSGVPLQSTYRMSEACEHATLLEHQGTRFVPEFRLVLSKIKDYLHTVFAKTGETEHDKGNIAS